MATHALWSYVSSLVRMQANLLALSDIHMHDSHANHGITMDVRWPWTGAFFHASAYDAITSGAATTLWVFVGHWPWVGGLGGSPTPAEDQFPSSPIWKCSSSGRRWETSASPELWLRSWFVDFLNISFCELRSALGVTEVKILEKSKKKSFCFVEWSVILFFWGGGRTIRCDVSPIY